MELRACVRQIATRAFVPRLVSILVFPLAIGIAGADTPAERTLHRFDRLIEGTRPFGLVAGANGALYGVTFEGGFNGVGCYNGVGCGTVFSLTPTASGYRERVLYRFKGTVQHVVIPGGGLLIDGSGTLYGTLWWTGSTFAGSVYKLTPSRRGYVESDVYDFQGPPNDGEGPSGDLIVDASGALYGATLGGGGTGCGANTGCGTVFKLTPATAKRRSASRYSETILYRFQGGTDGRYPSGDLVADASGALYGTTQGNACESDCGTVFKLTPNASGGYAESVLHHFGGGSDGTFPVGGLIIDRSGALYGATSGGGTARQGTIYKLTPQPSGGYAETVLYSFQGGSDGADPVLTHLLADATGALYGTTLSGGAAGCYRFDGCGTIFKLTPQGSGGYAESILHRFGSTPDGAFPVGDLLIDRTGALYGTARGGGGSRRRGTVFKLSP